MPDDNRNTPNMTPQRRRRGLIYMLILAVFLGYFIMSAGSLFGAKTKTIATNEFVTAVKEDRVREVTYRVEDRSLSGKFYENADAKKNESLSDFRSAYVGEDNLDELMAKHSDVKFTVDTSNNDLWQTLLISVLPTAIMIAIIIYFMNQMQGQNGRAMSFGRTQAKTEDGDRPKVRFKDVAGIDEVVEELKEVREVRSGESRRELCQGLEVYALGEGFVLGVHAQNLLAAFHVGTVDRDLAVKATGTQKRGVEDVGSVGGGDEDHGGVVLKAVHLNKQLVERLLALVVPATQTGATLTSDRVDLVDEHDGGRRLLGLLEQVANAGRTNAHEHLNKVGARNREERDARLACNSLCQQCLSCSGRSY